MQMAFAVLWASWGVLPAGQSSEQPPVRRPNFIVVMADDLGYGDLGLGGSQMIRTPHLDRMASEGIRLTGFFSSANVCTPSRAGLMTGRYAIRMGLEKDVIFPEDTHGIPSYEITLGEALLDLGYRTACVGKWHLGHAEPHWPTNNGFEHFYGLPYSNDMMPLALFRGTEKIEEPVDQSTLTERYTAEAVQFMETHQDEPFFIYLPHTMPHIPLHVSYRFRGRSRAGLYGDVVETIDWSMGQIFEALRRLELDEKTLVIFTSDNGPWFEGSSGELRDRKGSSWEGGQRVPFLARWPGRIPPGTISNAISMNTDIFPTLIKLAGGTLPEDRPLDGRDLWSVLQGSRFSSHECLYLFTNETIAAVRTQRWKLVLRSFYRTGESDFGKEERRFGPYWLLFDMEGDPGEQYSLARGFPEVLDYMRSLLAKGREDLGAR